MSVRAAWSLASPAQFKVGERDAYAAGVFKRLKSYVLTGCRVC